MVGIHLKAFKLAEKSCYFLRRSTRRNIQTPDPQSLDPKFLLVVHGTHPFDRCSVVTWGPCFGQGDVCLDRIPHRTAPLLGLLRELLLEVAMVLHLFALRRLVSCA